jgi:hypothetical protein
MPARARVSTDSARGIHWAVKYVDLYRVLHEAILESALTPPAWGRACRSDDAGPQAAQAARGACCCYQKSLGNHSP